MSCTAPRSRAGSRALTAAAVVVACVAFAGGTAGAAQSPVGLGSADNFAILAGAGITNTGPTTITGDVGTFPTTSETGFNTVTLNGTNQDGNAVTQQAKSDLVTAYNDAAGRSPVTTLTHADLSLDGTLVPGVYDTTSLGPLSNTGTLTLSGNGVYIFQTNSTLITGSGSTVSLGGADPCNIYWQVGSSATLGTGSMLAGTILALTSITLNTSATLAGRALARNGAVTLNSNTITRSSCTTPTTTTTTVTSTTNPSTTGQFVTFTANVTATGGGTPTGSVTFFDNGVALGTVPLDTNGNATFTTSALGPGSHSITALFLGGPGFETGASPALTQTVNSPTALGATPASSTASTALAPAAAFTG